MIEKSDIQILNKALAFATHKHWDQPRKDRGASPYINHPVALVDLLVNEGGITDPEILCAALLHDTVEDTDTTPEELTDAFGGGISSIVMEVTDNKKRPKRKRKQRQIKHAPHLSTKAKAVKLADKICNMRNIIDCPPHWWSLERRQQYYDWAMQVIDGLRGEWSALESVFDWQYLERPIEEDNPQEQPKKQFVVFVDDNFHYQDESERYELGDFETYEEAVTACKAIVDSDLQNMHSEGKSAASLYGQYTSFGDDPFVRPVPTGKKFSAWEYAKQRCAEMCSVR